MNACNRKHFNWRSLFGPILLGAITLSCATRTSPGATLAVEVPAGDDDAELWVDGNYVGQVREVMASSVPLRLAPGRHRVEIRKVGRFPAQRTVEVTAESTNVLVETTLPSVADE
jgi:hypothetical protein